MFAGTDTGGKSMSTGIYAYRWEPVTGVLSPLGLAAETASPTYMTFSPNRHLLYTVNEVNEYHGSRTGTVSSFELNGVSGRLTFKNLVSSGGAGPASIAIDQTGRPYLLLTALAAASLLFRCYRMAASVTRLLIFISLATA
jgi:6-phosphogluconolactonase